jgi:large subunit ribosomal protein L21
MIGRLMALGAAVVAAGAGAAVWARRKAGADPQAAQRPPGGSAPAPTKADAAKPSAAAAPGRPDDLTTIKGIGAVSSERLAEAGVTTVAQIAAWTDADIDAIAARIKVSPERIRREDWAGQARSALEGGRQ